MKPQPGQDYPFFRELIKILYQAKTKEELYYLSRMIAVYLSEEKCEEILKKLNHD